MNFLKKTDHYLKINHPHIWQTRVHDFFWFSLILGNGLAVLLGVLLVGQSSVFAPRSLATMHFGLAVLLGFVGLFWAMRLLRFKIRFPNFKTMLTTWLIYVLCIGSLGLNLAVFTSTIAYRTASLYSDKVVEADEEYLDERRFFDYNHSYISFDNFNILKEDYRTEELFSIMVRHGCNPVDDIYMNDLINLSNRLEMIQAAKTFVHQPILGTDFYNDRNKRSFYHELLQMNWGTGMFALFFLPTLLFLVSSFGVKNVLVSIFCTTLISGLTILIMDVMHMLRYNEEAYALAAFAFVAFILGLTLVVGRYRLRAWNYIAGVFMLMLGVVFLASWIVIVDNFNLEKYILPTIAAMLPVSLMVSLMVAWAVAKRNDMPVLR